MMTPPRESAAAPPALDFSPLDQLAAKKAAWLAAAEQRDAAARAPFRSYIALGKETLQRLRGFESDAETIRRGIGSEDWREAQLLLGEGSTLVRNLLVEVKTIDVTFQGDARVNVLPLRAQIEKALDQIKKLTAASLHTCNERWRTRPCCRGAELRAEVESHARVVAQLPARFQRVLALVRRMQALDARR